MPLPEHFMISESDGGLYDTRKKDWFLKPVRANYRKHHAKIRSIADLKATLRAGAYAWPGGYPLFLCDEDGDAFHFACVRKMFKSVLLDGSDYGWKISGCDVNYDDDSLYCALCGERIESAYGEPQEAEEDREE